MHINSGSDSVTSGARPIRMSVLLAVCLLSPHQPHVLSVSVCLFRCLSVSFLLINLTSSPSLPVSFAVFLTHFSPSTSRSLRLYLSLSLSFCLLSPHQPHVLSVSVSFAVILSPFSASTSRPLRLCLFRCHSVSFFSNTLTSSALRPRHRRQSGVKHGNRHPPNKR